MVAELPPASVSWTNALPGAGAQIAAAAREPAVPRRP